MKERRKGKIYGGDEYLCYLWSIWRKYINKNKNIIYRFVYYGVQYRSYVLLKICIC